MKCFEYVLQAGSRELRAAVVGLCTCAVLTGCLQVQTPARISSVPAAAPADAVDVIEGDDVDSGPYPRFDADPSITGPVRCIGSSAVGLVLNAMRGDFAQAAPGIQLEVISSGSGDAPKRLAAGESDLAPMSRAMRPDEIALIEKARGCKVEYVDIAFDAIAICVNRKNPTTQLSMRDLDRVFGRERRLGGDPALTWGDLGLRDADWVDAKPVLFGMGSNTGSNGIVQESVLKGGAFRTSVNEEPVASSVVQGIAANTFAIGYCSAYFVDRAPRVRALKLEATDGSGFVELNDATIRSGRYPLSRRLRIYYVRDPVRPNPAAMQFLRFLVSDDGQWVIGALGQRQIAPEQAHASFKRLAP
jgi:phosphate transport system substrate-binding protein